MIKVKTNTWHYWIFRHVYNLYSVNGKEPRQTNLCEYVKYLFAALPTFLLIFLATAFVGSAFLILWLAVNAVTVFSGMGICSVWDVPKHCEYQFAKVHHRFPPLWIGKHSIPFPALLGSAYATIALGWLIAKTPDHAAGLFVGITVIALAAIVMFVLAVAFTAVINVIRRRSSDTWAIVRAYLRAKKTNVCPIITFVDDASSKPPTAVDE